MVRVQASVGRTRTVRSPLLVDDYSPEHVRLITYNRLCRHGNCAGCKLIGGELHGRSLARHKERDHNKSGSGNAAKKPESSKPTRYFTA